MSKYVVVVVPEESKAYDAARALQQLHEEGSVTVYGAAVIERKLDGTIEVKRGVDQGPLGMAVGALVGGLIGLLGGPAVAALGMASGTMVGGWGDIMRAGVGQEFVDDIANKLPPGSFAVISEVSEDWTAPIDTKMAAIGGIVLREYRDEFVDDMIEKRADAVRHDLDQRKREHANAKATKMSGKLGESVDGVRKDLQKTATKARERLEQKKDEMNAKLDALRAQAAKADPDVRKRIEQRIDDIRAELQSREQKLNHAFELAQEALNA